MSLTQTNNPQINVNKGQDSLFQQLYYFPVAEQDLKDYKQIDSKIRQIISSLKRLQKNNVEQIQRICYNNKKIQTISKFLLNQKVSILVTNLFSHLLLNPKLLSFIIKINVPLIIYFNLIRLIQKQKQKSIISTSPIKDKQIQQNFKFLSQYCKLQPKRYPRLYANLISTFLIQNYDPKGIAYINQNTSTLILDTSILILKNNFILAAQSEILQSLFQKVVNGQVNFQKSKFVIDLIVNYCNCKDTRDVVHGCIDIGKAFAKFNNVETRHHKNVHQSNQSIKSQQTEEGLLKTCMIIQTLLNSWPTLLYFISQKATLMNFISALPRNSPFEIQIIKKHILKKIIIRTLTYNKQKMFKSLNMFGFKSNYLNYRGLVLINFLLKHNALYETFQAISSDGQLLQSISSLCLQYFPGIFQSDKYNRKIIKNIKFPQHYQTFITKQDYKKKLQSYNESIIVNLKSFCKPALISFYFEPKQLRDYLIWLKQNKQNFDDFSQQVQDQIQISLKQLKQLCQNMDKNGQKNKIQALLANFYKIGIQASSYIPWKAQNLKFWKFLSSILQYLINNHYQPIQTLLMITMESMFANAKKNYDEYLIWSILDDFGKHLAMQQKFQSIMIQHCRDQKFAFRIGKILLNMDYEKATDKYNKSKKTNDVKSPKKLLQQLCHAQASGYIILRIIQIIKNVCLDCIQKNQQQTTQLIQIISNNLIYHRNQQIVSSSIQFFQQILNEKILNLEKYIKTIKIQKMQCQFYRKRVAYLFLIFQGGLDIVNSIYPHLFKQQLENWFNKGTNVLKQYSNFLLKQVKRFNNIFIKQKQTPSYMLLGFDQQQRRLLSNLPWNVIINNRCYPALSQFKMLKQKIKLRVKINLIIQQQISISLLNIGSDSFGKNLHQSKQSNNITTVNIRIQEIMKSHQRNKSKDNKEMVTKFAVSKEQVTFFICINADNQYILERLNVNIQLQKNIYRPILYPQNLIYFLGLTRSGMQFLRKQRFLQKCVEKIDNAQKGCQLQKQNLLILGCYCSSQKQITQKNMIYDAVMKIYVQTKNMEIRQICNWIFNILSKDQQIKRRMKEQKKWRIVETKYCGTMFFYNYSSQSVSKKQQQYNHLNFIKDQMPQKLLRTLCSSILQISLSTNKFTSSSTTRKNNYKCQTNRGYKN